MQKDAVEIFARFVAEHRFADLSPAVIERTQWLILDTLAAGLAGHSAPGAQELRQLAWQWGGAAQSQVWGADRLLPAPLAGLLNGTAARALELDSIHEVGMLHAMVTALPAALAAADAKGGVAGSELLIAVLIGADLVSRMGLAPRVGFSVSGMSFTFQCGVFGAAAAAARIFGLDTRQTLAAFGLAYNMVSGNQQALHEGSLSVRVQQGVVVQTGLMAASMAAHGLPGPRDAFEGRFGYFPVYHRGDYDRQVLLGSLGDRFEVMNTSVKPYPCCRFIHPAIDATLTILGKRQLAPHHIDAVEVRVDNLNHYNIVCEPLAAKQHPANPPEAQFALPFIIANVLVRGRLTLADMNPAALADPTVRELAYRVRGVISDAARQDSARSGYPPGVVNITLKSGETLTGTVPLAKGHPDRMLSQAELIDKFHDCAQTGGFPEATREAIIGCVRDLPAVRDTTELSRLLAAPKLAGATASNTHTQESERGYA